MIRHLIPTYFWICVMVYDFGLAQKITLHAVKQSDCITSCAHGLISDMDYVVFKSEVDITEDPNATTIFYQIMKQHDDRYKTICNIDVSVECNTANINPMCGCKKIGNYLLYITIVYKTHYSNSGASIIGTVVRSKDHEPVRSNEQKFPLIYASDNTKVMLQINNKNIDLTSEWVEHIKENYLGVTFSCTSPATPCLAEFSIDDSTEKLNGSGKIFYYRFYNISKTLTLTIKSAACRLDGNVTELHKKIQIDLESKPEKESSFDDIKYIEVAMLLIMILILLILIVVFCVKKKSLKKNLHKIMNSRQNIQEPVSISETLQTKSSCAHSIEINKENEVFRPKNEYADLKDMFKSDSKNDNNCDSLEDDISHQISVAWEVVTLPSRNKDTSLPILTSADIELEMRKYKVNDAFGKHNLWRSLSAYSITQQENITMSNVHHLKKSKASIYYSTNETQPLNDCTIVESELGVVFKNRNCLQSTSF